MVAIQFSDSGIPQFFILTNKKMKKIESGKRDSNVTKFNLIKLEKIKFYQVPNSKRLKVEYSISSDENVSMCSVSSYTYESRLEMYSDVNNIANVFSGEYTCIERDDNYVVINKRDLIDSDKVICNIDKSLLKIETEWFKSDEF